MLQELHLLWFTLNFFGLQIFQNTQTDIISLRKQSVEYDHVDLTYF